MRADAERNYGHLLAVAREVIAQNGAETSLRDIARRANVGLGTLYRHFPTREALLEALLHAAFENLVQVATDLESSRSPDEALAAWFREGVAFVRTYGGVVAVMAAAVDDPDSALHASCTMVRSTGARLLQRAQADGTARVDLDGTDVLALMGALGWIGDQPAFAPRVAPLCDLIADALFAKRSDTAG